MTGTPSSSPSVQENAFSSEIKLGEKKFEIDLKNEADYLIISVNEKCENKFIQNYYKEYYTIDSLRKIHKFFNLYDDVNEVINAFKTAISSSLYKLEEAEKSITLTVFCFDKEIKLTIHSKPQADDEKFTTFSNDLFVLKKKFSAKAKEIEQFNTKFLKIKNQYRQLTKQNKELQAIVNNLRDNKTLDKKIETILANTSKTNGDIQNLKEEIIKIVKENFEVPNNNAKKNQRKNEETVDTSYEGKLTGDLLTENTIAFDKHCKNFLCKCLLGMEHKNKTVNTVLLYKGSRDGDKAETFHKKCDNKGPTLTLVKSTTGYHFGGFTLKKWESAKGYRSTSDSFLFSLDKILQYPSKTKENYIIDNPAYGPTFGIGFDLHIADGCMNNENSFSKTASFNIKDTFTGSEKFKVSEIEVYKIIFQ